MKKGFTLIELLAVILILGIIALIAVSKVTNIVAESKISALRTESNQVIKTIISNDIEELNKYKTIDDLKSIGIKTNNFESFNVGKSNNDTYIEIVGKNEWAGYVACGTLAEIEVYKKLEDCKIKTDSLILHMPMDENANDISGNNNHGILKGPSLVEGKYGNGYSFDGVDDRIETNLLLTSPTFTAGAWIYHYELTGVGDAIMGNSYWDVTWKKGFVARFWQNDTKFCIEGGGSSSYFSNCKTINLREWVYITFTYDGTKLNSYINGVLFKSTTSSYDISNILFSIGTDNTNKGNVFYHGIIDDVRIYSKALDNNDIIRIMNNQDPLNG